MIELLATTTWLVVACALLGLLVGSFLNVVILRLPARLVHAWREQAREVLAETDAKATGDDAPRLGTRETDATEAPPPDLVFKGSHCPHCRHPLSPWENVPLASFLALRGKCRHCRAPISWQYPAVEAITALLFALCALQFGFGAPLLAALAATAILVAASGIDLRTQLLPDQLTLPLLWLGLVGATMGWFVEPEAAILGAAAGYLVLWSVYWTFKLATGREGMGYGDFKLLAALGAFVGWMGLIPILLMSSVVGAVLGTLWLVARGKDRATPIPFGQFLAIAGWIQLVYGEYVLAAWQRWLGI